MVCVVVVVAGVVGCREVAAGGGGMVGGGSGDCVPRNPSLVKAEGLAFSDQRSEANPATNTLPHSSSFSTLTSNSLANYKEQQPKKTLLLNSFGNLKSTA